MQTTEYLNPNLPQAHIKGGDGIGGKYENMLNAYGKIEDHSAVENIDRDNEQEKKNTKASIRMQNCNSWILKPRGKLNWRKREKRKKPMSDKRERGVGGVEQGTCRSKAEGTANHATELIVFSNSIR